MCNFMQCNLCVQAGKFISLSQIHEKFLVLGKSEVNQLKLNNLQMFTFIVFFIVQRQ